MKRKSVSARVGTRLITSLTEVRDALASGKALKSKFNVHTVEVIAPSDYDAVGVRKIRDELGVSQTIFARLVGVSPELVQHWEQGVTTPRPIARRLFDQIAIDPAAYLKRSLDSSRRSRVA